MLYLIAIGGPALGAHSRISGATYLKDVAPILEKRCVGCHASSATIALDSYEGARQWARAMRESVLERRMPPWPAAPGFGDYRNDRSLTPVEIELLTAWIEGRTPLGTVDATAPMAAHTHGEAALDPDAGVRIALPDAHPNQGQLERLSLTMPMDGERSITEWEFQPADAAALIQRATFAVDGVHLGSWVPSQRAVTLPSGVSIAAGAGSRVIVEMQYVKSRVATIAPGTLTLRFGARGSAPSSLQLSCGEHTIRANARALAITPAAARAGDSVEVVARYPDGRVEPFVVVPRFMPAYPLTYEFREPRRLPRGTVIDVSSSSPGCSAGLDLIYAPRAR